MTHQEAIDFISPAIDGAAIDGAIEAPPRTWADLGAGSGTFTRALAHLLGRKSRVIAVEKDTAAIAKLQRLARTLPASSAAIDVVSADLQQLDSVAELDDVVLDGALFGNVLHFFSNAAPLLAMACARLTGHGRVVVLEYDGVKPSPWVPYPLSIERLTSLAATLGFGAPDVVARRASRYRGTMYCAVLERPAGKW